MAWWKFCRLIKEQEKTERQEAVRREREIRNQQLLEVSYTKQKNRLLLFSTLKNLYFTCVLKKRTRGLTPILVVSFTYITNYFSFYLGYLYIYIQIYTYIHFVFCPPAVRVACSLCVPYLYTYIHIIHTFIFIYIFFMNRVVSERICTKFEARIRSSSLDKFSLRELLCFFVLVQFCESMTRRRFQLFGTDVNDP